jgi:3-oxoadipate enol-lactonase
MFSNSPPTQYFTTSSGVKIAYNILRPQAKKTPVVLISGYAMVKEDWGMLPFKICIQQRQVLVFDNRGVGKSSVPDTDEYLMEDMANDTVEMIRTVFPKRQVHIVGFSMGGSIAQYISLRHPDIVKSISLVGARCTASTSESRSDVVDLEHALRANLTDDWIQANGDRFSSFVSQYMKYNRPFYGVMAQRSGSSKFNLKEEFEQHKTPILYCAGEKDHVLDMEQLNYMIKKKPDMEVHIVPRLGHFFFVMDEADVVLTILSNFIDKYDN